MGLRTPWRFSLMHESKNIAFLSHEDATRHLFLLVSTVPLLFPAAPPPARRDCSPLFSVAVFPAKVVSPLYFVYLYEV